MDENQKAQNEQNLRLKIAEHLERVARALRAGASFNDLEVDGVFREAGGETDWTTPEDARDHAWEACSFDYWAASDDCWPESMEQTGWGVFVRLEHAHGTERPNPDPEGEYDVLCDYELVPVEIPEVKVEMNLPTSFEQASERAEVPRLAQEEENHE